MSHLPEPGEAKAAAETFTRRVQAMTDGGDAMYTGPISVKVQTGEMGGDVDPLRKAYGDLFDPGEVLAEGGVDLALRTIVDIGVHGHDPIAGMLSAYMQGVALGVLMERARWERQR